MSLQLILGPSGSGKSHYIYNKIIEDGLKDEDTNYILLVPEQYSMALQRKLVMLHPAKAVTNIDVFGFNRLCFRVFDEQHVVPGKVMEDFGKSMMIRKAAGDNKDKLNLYAGSLDKTGFIDEVKSLMSEMYQYSISNDKIHELLDSIEPDEREKLLYMKLKDVSIIKEAFEEKIESEYIVAEKLQELLAEHIESSDYIKRSVIVMDGFTGFTPVQMPVIEKLLMHAKKVYGVFTIDRRYYDKKNVKEHELFYLSKKTIADLKETAITRSVPVEEDIFMDGEAIDNSRWQGGSRQIAFLEKNLFRFPYNRSKEVLQDISIKVYDTPRKELSGVAYEIKRLVGECGYRYKDIAVISGDLKGTANVVEPVFKDYEIPYFLDMTVPVRDNPYINSIEYALRIVRENFSYDSVFAFLKSGVVSELDYDDIETLENYVLRRGIRGKSYWNRTWNDDEEVEDKRACVMDILMPFYEAETKKGARISDNVSALLNLMDRLGFEERLASYENGGNGRLYEKLISVFDKLSEILGDEQTDIGDFTELVKLGISELTLGMIPPKLDMVQIGDITRTRLEDVRCLFIIGVNDGIIPKKENQASIISDSDKDRLSELGLTLAPTARFNSFVEQFYLYLNLTKPSDKLYISYTKMNQANDQLRPSYLIARIKGIFTELSESYDDEPKPANKKTGIEALVTGIHQIMNQDYTNLDQTMALYKLYHDMGEEKLAVIEKALIYNNVPKKLTGDISSLLKVKLLSQSVSRLEKFAGCAYAYFLQYTLSLSERRVREIDSRNIGIIIHSAMEHMYRHVHDNMDNDWSTIDDKKRDELIDVYIGEAFDAEYNTGKDVADDIEQGRYDYLLDTLKRIGRRTAKVLHKITDGDLLKPEYFEYNFVKEIKDDEERNPYPYTMTLRGVVDRGDVYYSKEENSLKLRIIDYKLGNHDFKVSWLYEGLQLQLAVYMNIMLELVENQYNKDKPDEEKLKITPEGMYYYQMADPYVEAEDADKAEKERDKKLKLKGLIYDENFDTVNAYSIHKAKDIARHIIGGEIDKNPMVKDGVSTCEYCAYKEICRFDKKYGGNKERYPRYAEKDKALIYDKLAAELELKEDSE